MIAIILWTSRKYIEFRHAIPKYENAAGGLGSMCCGAYIIRRRFSGMLE